MRARRDALDRRVSELQVEIERLRHQLVRQEKLLSLGMLAAGIAHEINNPMS
jgi:two-component system, NtrC family, sensor kinase